MPTKITTQGLCSFILLPPLVLSRSGSAGYLLISQNSQAVLATSPSLTFVILKHNYAIFVKKDAGLEKRYKAVAKALRLLSENPRHPGLQTQPYFSFSGPNKEKVFEAYAEQNTPAAYRIFFYYGPSRGEITIFAITSHP